MHTLQGESIGMVPSVVLLSLTCSFIASSGVRALQEVVLCPDRLWTEVQCPDADRLAVTGIIASRVDLAATQTPCTPSSVLQSMTLPPMSLTLLLNQTLPESQYRLCSFQQQQCNVSVPSEVFQSVQPGFPDGSQEGMNHLRLQYECIPEVYIVHAEHSAEVKGPSVFLLRQTTTPPVPASHSCSVCALSELERLQVRVLDAPLTSGDLCTLTFEDGNSTLTLNCSSEAVLNGDVIFASQGYGLNITVTFDDSLDDLLWLRISGSQGNPVRLLCGEAIVSCVPEVTAPPVTTTVQPPWRRQVVVFNAENPVQVLECQSSQYIALTDATFHEESCDSYRESLPSMDALVIAALLEHIIAPCSFTLGACNVNLTSKEYHVDLTQFYPSAETPAVRLLLGYKCVDRSLLVIPGDNRQVFRNNVYLAVDFRQHSRIVNSTCVVCAVSFYDRIHLSILDIPRSTDEGCTFTLSEVTRNVTFDCSDSSLLLQRALYVTDGYDLTIAISVSENFTARQPLWLNISGSLGQSVQLACGREDRTPVCPVLKPTTLPVPTLAPSTVDHTEVVIQPTSPEGMSLGSIVGLSAGGAVFVVIGISVGLVVRNKMKHRRKPIDSNPHANPDDDDDDEDESEEDVEAAKRPRTAVGTGGVRTPQHQQTQGHLPPLQHTPRRKKKKKREFKRPMRDPFEPRSAPPAPRPVPAALLPKAPLPAIPATK